MNAFQNRLFDNRFRDEIRQCTVVLGANGSDKRLSFLSELDFRDEFAIVNAFGEDLKDVDITQSCGAIVLVISWLADRGDNIIPVELEDIGIDINRIRLDDFREIQQGQDRSWKGFWRGKRMFVW